MEASAPIIESFALAMLFFPLVIGCYYHCYAVVAVMDFVLTGSRIYDLQMYTIHLPIFCVLGSYWEAPSSGVYGIIL